MAFIYRLFPENSQGQVGSQSFGIAPILALRHTNESILVAKATSAFKQTHRKYCCACCCCSSLNHCGCSSHVESVTVLKWQLMWRSCSYCCVVAVKVTSHSSHCWSSSKGSYRQRVRLPLISLNITL